MAQNYCDLYTVKNGTNSESKLLLTISEQLDEIIDLLKRKNLQVVPETRSYSVTDIEPKELLPFEPRQFECERCGKAFADNRKLLGHKMKCKG